MTDDEETDLRRYLEGEMTPDALGAFENRLRQDAGLRRNLVLLAGLEADLPDALRRVAPVERSKLRVRATASASPALPPRGRAARWLPGLAAVAATALIAVGILSQKDAAPTVQPAQLPVPAAPSVPAVPATPAEARIAAANGTVWVALGEGMSPVAAVPGTEVRSGGIILTATNASAQLVYADGSTIELYRGSALRVGRNAEGPTLELRRGAFDASIQPQPNGQCLRVLGEQMCARIVGTQFRVMADSKSTWLGVREGSVAVTRVSDGTQVTLAAGNYAAVAPDWPYLRMDARVCPVWKGVCRQAVGTPYP